MVPTFTPEEFDAVCDLMVGVEWCSVGDALDILDVLGYSDTVVYKNYTCAVSCVLEDHDRCDLAHDTVPMWWRGGPGGDVQYLLSLQCLLEDHLLQCCVLYGPEMVKNSMQEGQYV